MASGLESVMDIFQTIKFILVWFWWAILLVWVGFLKFKWKNWPIEAVIIEKRGENLIKTNDRCGRYKDPYTGMTGYKLMKSKDSVPVVDFNIVLHNNAIHTNMLERFVNLIRGNSGTIFLFRYGSKQYKPIRINQTGKVHLEEVKDKDGNPVMINMYKPLDPRNVLGVLDFEVVDWDNMNQMVQEWKATIERRQKSKEFWKQIVIPAIIIGATVIFSIVMIKFGYDFAMNLKGSSAPAPADKPAEKPNIPIINDVIPG